MAGNLLLIRKPYTDKKNFDRLCSRAENIILEIFSPYYNHISFISPGQNSWLAIFHKNSENKFIMTSRGWMVFEGMVFALNRTSVHSIESLWENYLASENIVAFANSLDGHFVIKLYDAKKDRYYIINDFIKDKSHYYSESGSCFCYTSFSFLTALIRKPVPDLYAVNEYFWRYYVLSERTYLQGTRRMSPASVHTISGQEIKHEHYWKWPTTYSESSFQDQVDMMIESMRETVRLIASNFHPHLDFTQGQDSRQNVAAFLNQKVNFSTSIFGKESFEEVKATLEMAQRYSIDHHNITLGEDFTNDPLKHFDRAVILGSAEEPGHLLGRIMYMREKQSVYGDLLCNGMEGHFYKNGLWDEMYTFNLYREPAKFSADMFLDLRLLSQNYHDKIFSKDLLDIKSNSREYFHDMIDRSIKGMEHAPVSMQVDRFDLTHWLNFQFVSNSGSNAITNTCSPLLFKRNLEHALRVPVKWKFNLSRYQRAIVHQLHSELASEKTDFGGVSMRPKNTLTYLPFLARYGWHQSQRLRNKYLRKLGFHPKTHLQEAWDYEPVYRNLFRQIKNKERFDIKQMALQDLLDTKQWNRYLESLYTRDNPLLNDYEYLFKVSSLDTYFHLSMDIHRKVNQ
ncbi:MAG: hypothetical protein U5N26_07175 [Candidatus Marinimicrobia bacterium]|nr:hypothetical protein [Candidatus Neomarinimicrobiota bacterium]